MAQSTGIEWTDASSNPLKYRNAKGEIVWACVKVSPGCAHCYSEATAQRYGRGGAFTRANMEQLTPYVCEKELRHLAHSKKLAGKRVFLGDMTDVFGEWVPDELLDRIFATIALRTDVTFQVLTKRADRMAEYMAGGRPWQRIAHQMYAVNVYSRHAGEVTERERWPLPNVWLGVSVENQAAADERIPLLMETPAAVRFLSCEPLLGPVDLGAYLGEIEGEDEEGRDFLADGIDWVIVGGESGSGARPMQIEWARALVAQCKDAGVACFVKQLGAKPTIGGGDGGPYDSNKWPLEVVKLRSGKGGDPDEWPADLRVREFPKVKA